MDFGKILDEWHKKEPGKRKGGDLESMLDRYPPPADVTGEKDGAAGRRSPGEERRRLTGMAPQASLDLHGYTATEAKKAIDVFFRESSAKGLRKVLIIHGKGHHSGGGPVLKDVVARYVAGHNLAGENAFSSREDGGSGARWVVLRQRSR